MTYVIADVHGYKRKLNQMLQLIGAGTEDKIIFLGDVIDRGPHGIAILQDIMKHRNRTLILGNHELMMLQFYQGPTEERKYYWDLNGGEATRTAFEKLTAAEQEEMLDFLRSCPTYLNLEVSGEKYHLVHGWPHPTSDYKRVWGKPPEGANSRNPLRDGSTLVVGHTLVLFLHTRDQWEIDYIIHRLIQDGRHITVFRNPKEKLICMDCGCGYTEDIPVSRLACICLENQRIFYV